METEVLIVDAGNGYAKAVRRAADIIHAGGVVAFPTETVYGLGVRADDSRAVARLREVKGRAAEKAFTVHLGSRDDAERFVPDLSGVARRLIRKGWPGPLTLILPVEDPSRAAAMSGLGGSVAEAMYYDGAIGLRCPDDPVASRLLNEVSAPVIASSANTAGQAPAQTAGEIVRTLNGQIDLVIDSGRTKYSKPSTVVRLTGSSPQILREGVFDARIVEQMAMLRILFVCSGNTCRSPMAAGIAKKLIAQQLGCNMDDLPVRGIIVESAGTSGGHGGAADHAIRVLADRGIDLSGHFSSTLRAETVQQSDYIFGMTRAHVDAVSSLVPAAAERVRLLLDGEDVADPIGGSRADYEACAIKITAGLEARLREVSL